MNRALVAFVAAVGIVALCESAALQSQETPAAVKDPIAPADCLKDKKKAPECHRLGTLYAKGEEVPLDEPRAIELLDAACRSGVAASCGVQGWLLLKRHERPEQVKQGEQLLERACKQGNLGACGALGRAYASGTGVARDVPKAVPLLEKACHTDAQSCMALAELLDAGDGIAVDAERAEALRSRACEVGPLGVCEQACDDGNGNACVALGDSLSGGKAPDMGRANRAYQRACNAAVAEGCYRLGWLTKEQEQTLPLFERACSLDYAPGCVEAGQRYLQGRGAEIDLAKAVRLYTKACDKDAKTACRLLGGIYARGELGSDEVARGQAYLAKACGEDAECRATVASGRIPSAWGGSLEALRPGANDKDGVNYDEPPRLLHQTKPVYPRRAFDRKIVGVVHLSITIDIDGRVVDVRVVRGNPELAAAAVECVRQWRFAPARRNGASVPTIADAPITFWLK